MSDVTMDNQQGNVLERIGYSVGVILGDGCLYANPLNSDYRILITMQDKDCLERVERELGMADVRMQRHRTADAWNLFYYGKDLCQAWRELTDNKTTVPYYYAFPEASKQARLDVIAGLIDTDGTIKERQKGDNWIYELCFYNSEWKIVDSFTHLLKLCNIRTSRVRAYETQSGRTGWDVGIVLKDFVQQGGYLHCARKNQRLINYKKRIKGRWAPEHAYHSRPSETRPATPCVGGGIVQTALKGVD